MLTTRTGTKPLTMLLEATRPAATRKTMGPERSMVFEAHVLQNVHAISTRLRLSGQDLLDLELATTLRDSGMREMPATIFDARRALMDGERDLVKSHVFLGTEMAGKHSAAVQQAILFHHERWDGHGYPYGLKHRQIPLLARIIAIADQFTALLYDRPHRPAWPLGQAYGWLWDQAGHAFDPHLVPLLTGAA